jgi:hypothetical protein
MKVGLIMKTLIRKVNTNMVKAERFARAILSDKRGESSIGIVVSILVSIVLGGLLLAGLYTIFGQQILPMIGDKIKSMFNYAG